MGFSEAQKKEVRQRAGYRCCWCQEVGDIEVHHIVPEKEGGTNDIDNAAPLCGRCHNTFGDNPSLRKQIRERRDWLYERVAKMYPDHPDPNLEKLSKLVGSIHEKQKRQDEFRGQIQAEMGEVKGILSQYVKTMEQNVKIMEQAVERLTPETVRSGTTSIMDASSVMTASLGTVTAKWDDPSNIGEGTNVSSPLAPRSTGGFERFFGVNGEALINTVPVGPPKKWPGSSDGEEM